MVDAREKQAIAILDVANTFLHTENDDNILMLLCGKLADMMVQVYPIMYRKYVTYWPNGQAMLYIIFSKALYGMLRADLFFLQEIKE